MGGAPEDHLRERHDRPRRQIPGRAVHARRQRNRPLRPARTILVVILARLARRLAREGAYQLAFGVQGDTPGLRLQVVVDEHAVEAANGLGRREQGEVVEAALELAQGGEVVHHLETAAAGRDGQGGAVHPDVGDRRVGQAMVELLPMVALVETTRARRAGWRHRAGLCARDPRAPHGRSLEAGCR